MARLHMMKPERMGLIAVAIMLLALLLAASLRRCAHNPASTASPTADSIMRALTEHAPDTIDTSATKSRKKKSTKQKREKKAVTPHQRRHLDEDTR